MKQELKDKRSQERLKIDSQLSQDSHEITLNENAS